MTCLCCGVIHYCNTPESKVTSCIRYGTELLRPCVKGLDTSNDIQNLRAGQMGTTIERKKVPNHVKVLLSSFKSLEYL